MGRLEVLALPKGRGEDAKKGKKRFVRKLYLNGNGVSSRRKAYGKHQKESRHEKQARNTSTSIGLWDRRCENGEREGRKLKKRTKIPN